MKNQTVGIGMYIAIGLAVIGIAILILFPIIRDVLTDADETRPTIPTTQIEVPAENQIVLERSDLA